MMRNRKLLRVISVFLLVQFCFQTFFPAIGYALTSGPSQPEFSSFEPVATTNMVDEFSGDFTYNLPVMEVPGPHGSGYPLSLSYHSGVTPEEEASWVGYGWTLNAGAINRNTRGIPDDHNGQDVIFHNKMPKNWTASAGGNLGIEPFGCDIQKLGANLSLSTSIRYNNYRGFGYTQGVGISLGKGLVSMGYSVSDGNGSFSLNVNPYAILSWNYKNTRAAVADIDRFAKNHKKYNENWYHKNRTGIGSSVNLIGNNYGIFSYSESAKPNIVHPYLGKSFNFSLGMQINPGPIPVGATVNVSGSYSYQENISSQTVPAYGYLYSGEVTKEPATKVGSLMDYHVEHEGDLNPRDAFIGVPFNDADNYLVSGEGIGGGFRMYNKTAGHFGPRHVENKVDIFNIGGEVAAGWTFGPGADLGKGISKLEVKDWYDRKNLSTFLDRADALEDEPVFFRFNNDLGGEWGKGHDDKPFQASYAGTLPFIPGNKIAMNQGERSGRSSFIDYHTNEEIVVLDEGDLKPSTVAYSRISKLNTYATRLAENHKKLIGEITVFTGSGLQYNYGLPVYNRNEKNLSYSAKGLQPEHNFIAFPASPNTEVMVGEERNSDYAATYLLTEILTPDYLDKGTATAVGEPGSSPDDLGGYTRFNYEKLAPGGDGWFNWRTPYRGLLYNKNSRSDAKDDLGSYSEGEKEIYMLHSIETKTHVAIFSTADREDGREANAGVTANTQLSGFKLKKLSSISLYTLDDCYMTNGKLDRDANGSPRIKSNAKAIKTVFFEYDDALNPKLPNHTPGATTGKLTLKRVYFEYNGINRVRISPYEFKYAYPDYTQYPSRYTAGIDNVVSGYSQFNADDQNPDYSYFLTDPWGYYQKNGDVRFEHSQPWIDQAQSDAHFDPAAWNLKVIKLPSGGEIHVQYEQDDYRYVQDQEAHVMASLKEDPSETKPLAVYKIDLTKIGLTTSSSQAEFDRALQLFNERYVKQGKKIYFKILYRLIGKELIANPDYELSPTCNAEYVSGYASVASSPAPVVDPTTATLTFHLKDQRFPREVCIDFVKSQRLGKVDPNSSCNPTGMSNPDSPKALVNQLSSMISSLLIPGDEDLCAKLDRNHSYFRIPMPLNKKGGGIRVKRLMMYDAGLGSEGPVLYGNEYRYETAEGLSSGVATNEPMTIREENILIDFVAGKGQDLWSKIVAGKDRDQSEGPIGESILPGPSVGYSRVVVKNIYSGQTRPTYSINEFYTAKDYPVKTGNPNDANTMTKLNKKNDKPEVIPAPFYSKVKTRSRATQGFSFILNSMHGQPRRQATYKGLYSNAPGVVHEEVSSTQYEYFKPGESIPMMSSLYGGVEQRNPGREVDITFAQRSVVENVNDVNVEVDLQVTVIPLLFIVLVIPYPTAIPSFSYVDGELSTHATTKVVRYPAIVKSTTVKQDGIEHTQENLAFDEYTGQPVAVRSVDEFSGGYLTQNIPASWEYQEMGGKWKTQGKQFRGTFALVGNTIAIPAGSCALGDFTRGDKIALSTGANTVHYYVTGLDWLYNRLEVVKANSSGSASGDYTTLTILSTGRTNQLSEQAGAITTHNGFKDNLQPVTISEADRYTAHDFSTHLKAATAGQTSAGDFTLPGSYSNMDMSGFAAELEGCVADVTNVTISGVQFLYTPNLAEGTASLQLMKFTVDCTAGADKTIKAEGWE